MSPPRPPKISWNRALTSYAKIQTCVGHLIRNRAFQLGKSRIRGLRYLDIGCGRNAHKNFINIDYLWHPEVDLCWDIKRGIPLPTGSMDGIFTEHCLEHFDLPVAFGILKECYRILAPGGVLRIVVPDGELYLNLYYQRNRGDTSVRFPFEDDESFEAMFSPILSVNRVYYQDRDSPYGHRCMFDFRLLELLLLRLGFKSVYKTNFGEGSDPTLLIDSESRRCESLYLEAERA
jgi:SAM-dependent methyltransferase